MHYKRLIKFKFDILLLLLFFSSSTLLYSQDLAQITDDEENLQILFDSIYFSTNDNLKLELNKQVLDIFEYMLYNDASFDYPFDSLKRIGKIKSPDGLLRLYTWNIAFSDKTNEYFGFIQYYSKTKKEYLIYPLIDKSDSISMPEKQSLDNTDWYGALYYKIIETESGRRKYYTLLGWDGYSDLITRKIIDVLYFTMSGKPHFGYGMFYMNKTDKANSRKVRKKRVIFSYSQKAKMTLHYDEKNEMIIFDHLSPRSPHLKGNYQYYGPDWTYEGLYFNKGKWINEIDVDVRNPKSKIKKSKWHYKAGEDIYKPKTEEE